MQLTAAHIVRILQNNGFEAYFVGGCVRDLLLKKEPQDFDIATNATPEQIESLFQKTYAIGKRFGVILIEENNHHFEVATFRSDSGYSDGRRPDFVTFSTAKEDALRRDFTINALYYDPIKESILDFVGGKSDLARGIIRFVGNPDERIEEDCLRLLRAIRFRHRLGYDYDTETRNALKRHSSLVNHISVERIRDELNKIIVHYSSKDAFAELLDFGILSRLIPDIEKLQWVTQPEDHHSEGNVWAHSVLVLSHIPPDSCLELYWAALFHDIGKMDTVVFSDGRLRYPHHQDASRQRAENWCHQFSFSRRQINKIGWLIHNHHIFNTFQDWKLVRKLEYFDHPYFLDLLTLVRADIQGSRPTDNDYTGHKKILEKLESIEENYHYAHSARILPSHHEPFFDGHQIQKILGLSSGEHIGVLKQKLKEAQLVGDVTTQGEALAWLKYQEKRLSSKRKSL